MKKFALIFAFMAFSGGYVLSQTLTWQFANFEVINAGAQVQFDVEVKADVGTTYHRDLQVYFDYNTAGFGSDVAVSTTITPLVLMDNFYVVVNTADNTGSKLAIITEAPAEMTPGSTDFNLMPSTFTGLLRITMNIIDNTATAGIAFDEALMNGGQYYQEIATANPIKYTDPCIYDNNLNSNLLSTLYGVITYANTGSTPLDNCTVDLYNGGYIMSGYTDATGNYYMSSVADGSFTLETGCTGTWGGLTNFDIIFVKRWLGGLMTFTDLQRLAGDVTQSGDPSNLDVIMLKRRVGGLSTPAWSAPDYVFLTQNVTVTSGIGNQDYQGLCSGDVNGSYIP